MTNIGTGMPNAHSKIQPVFPFSSFKIFIVVLQSLPRRSANDAAKVKLPFAC